VAHELSLYLLLTAGGLALVHVGTLLRGRALPWVSFVALGACLSTVAGLWAVHETVWAQARRSPLTGVIWGLSFALGFFAVGAVLAGAWAAGVHGLAAGLRRLRRREP
jgi:hypothetical protein